MPDTGPIEIWVLDYEDGIDYVKREPTPQEVIEWLIERAVEVPPGDPEGKLFYWPPTEAYPTQHNFMFEGEVSDA